MQTADPFGIALLAPRAAGMVFMAVAPPIFIGEVTLAFWLLFKRLDEDAWSRQEVTP